LPLLLAEEDGEGRGDFLSRSQSALRFLIRIDTIRGTDRQGASIYDPSAMLKADATWVIMDILASRFAE